MLAVAKMPKKIDKKDEKKTKRKTRTKRKKIDVVDDKEISKLSNDLNELSIEQKKIVIKENKSKNKSNKLRKKSKIPTQRLTKLDLDFFIRKMEELSLNSKKREEYKFNTRVPLCDGDDLENSYIAILPIVVGHQIFKEEKNKNLKQNDHRIKKKSMCNPLVINDIVISSLLYDRKGHLIFHPTSKFDDFTENDDNDESESESDEYKNISSKWENMDNETVLKLFKSLYNIVSKKPKNILSKKYIQYSPNVAIYIVFVKKEYKLKNANFGDKHFPWAWCRQWEMYNDWVPNTDNDGFHRSGDPYIFRLTEKDNNPGRTPIRYTIRDYDNHSDKDNKEIKKTAPYRITYKYIYEEIAKFNKNRGGLF